MPREITVEIKGCILGDGIFWRGSVERISEICNIPARELAELVTKDGKPRSIGMWHVRMESTKY